MSSPIQYEPVGGDHSDNDLGALEFHNELPDEWNGITENMRSGPSPSVSEPDMLEQHAPAKFELPQEFRTSTYLDDAPILNNKPPWQDPVRWCMWGNIMILAIKVIFTVTAVGLSASKGHNHGFGSISIYQGSCQTTQYMKIGLHLLTNVLSVAMTATNSYCCTILMAPSRTDVDEAHVKGTWLSIGVSSWRNFRNIKPDSRILWGLLLFSSLVIQMVYNTVIYSSINSNTYPVIVAPSSFVSNTSVPTSYFEHKNCFPDKLLHGNIADLRTDIFNGIFEYLSK